MSEDHTDNKEPLLPSQPVYIMYAPESRDDSLSLADIAKVLWERKWLIVAMTATFVVAGVIYALLAAPVYRAQVVLAPTQSEEGMSLPSGLGGLAGLAGINLGGSGDATNAVAAFRSRVFIEEFIKDNDLLPVFFPDQWDEENQRWIEQDPEAQPDIRDGVRFFIENVRSIEEDSDTGLVTLSLRWRDPERAAAWAEELVVRINERMRARDLSDSQRRLEYLNQELEASGLVELRQAIGGLIEDQIETIMLAEAEEEYAFRVIDPPRVPDMPVAPRKRLIVIFAALAGALLGSLAALVSWILASRRSVEA